MHKILFALALPRRDIALYKTVNVCYNIVKDANMPYLWLAVILISAALLAMNRGPVPATLIAGAASAFGISLYGGRICLQTAVFLIIPPIFAVAATIFKAGQKKRSVIKRVGYAGRAAIVAKTVGNPGISGRIRIDGGLWHAETAEGANILHTGEIVRIIHTTERGFVCEPGESKTNKNNQ